MDDLIREFLIESQDGLDRMEQCLTELEERPEDAGLLAEIFRSVHTIKGTTGFLGFSRLEALSHAGENLLGLLRDGKIQADSRIISALLGLLDDLRTILQSIETTGGEGEASDDGEMIERLRALAEVSEAAPAPVRRRRRRQLKQEEPAEEIAVQQPEEGKEEDKPVPAKRNAATAEEPAIAHSGAAESTLRVDIGLLNRMMNLVGELVLTRNQILQAHSPEAGFAPLARRLDMVTADLREAVMKARMQPVSHVFSKFPRLVRDLSQQLGKPVKLELEGQETELDKSLLEAIKDPLTHSVRNAIDHGIEAPEVRQAAGKSPEGLLKLTARQQGSYVMVEVTDDGGGIRVERIRDKVIERRLITTQKAAQLSDRELLQLIFMPGFSTADKVTNVSGRGVGMDVVRTNVERIGGKVEIDSRPGGGTTLRLSIPLTLAIIPALIVRCREQNFALPQGPLFELVHLTAEQAREQIEWLENIPLYLLRGRLLPLVFLDRLLAQKEAGEGAGCYIAVLNADGRRYGLVVDGLADPEEIVVKPLSAVLKGIGLFSGATVMGNGEMALILDPGAIAVRAGIGLDADEEEAPQNGEETAIMTGSEFLMVETGGEEAALPLEEILRIERIPRARFERMGQRLVLRLNGSLLPLEDRSGILAGPAREDSEITVVVCRDGGRHVGITVSQVVDVASGAPLTHAGTDIVAPEVTLLKERVTSVIDYRADSGTGRGCGGGGMTQALEAARKASAPVEDGIEMCSVRVGEMLFGVPIMRILEILNAPATRPVPLAPAHIGGLVHYRGEILTAISLRSLLGMPAHAHPPDLLVFEGKDGEGRDGYFGLLVDAVGEVLTVSPREFEPNPSMLDDSRKALFSGTYKLENGLLVMLDPARFDPVRLSE
ncbi:MAG: chemotaxis protein CheW [Silvibacterium sp.]|nr:chemotaxis protein CheW [Silvibacterium sp.]